MLEILLSVSHTHIFIGELKMIAHHHTDFARTCEKWVDGIEQFKHLPDGRSHEPLNGPFAG